MVYHQCGHEKEGIDWDFKNAGQAWCQEAECVNVYDFLQDAVGRAVPYGIYDLTHNRGHVYVGASADTAQFAVDAIATCWQTKGALLFHRTALC